MKRKSIKTILVAIFLFLASMVPRLGYAYDFSPTNAQAPTPSEVLIVYNSNITTDSDTALCGSTQESQCLAQYYATARGIPSVNVLGIAAPTTSGSDVEIISKTDYINGIETPIENYLSSATSSDNILLKNKIRDIVLMKGIPLKINDGYGKSVDTSVAQLFTPYVTTSSNLGGALFNPYFNVDSLFAGSYHFIANTFSVGSYALNYIVTRLDGQSVADVKGMVDRSLAADTSGQKYFVIDEMVTDYYGYQSTNIKADVTLRNFRYNDIYDGTNATLTTNSILASSSPETTPMIGYFSYGENSQGGQSPMSSDIYTNEIANTNGSLYANGAVAETFESYSGLTVTGNVCGNQSCISDFIDAGGSGGFGNVYEPYSTSLPATSIWMPAYARGYTWGEAAYMSIPYINWQNIVLGDPLMTINSDPFIVQGIPLPPANVTAIAGNALATVSFNSVSANPAVTRYVVTSSPDNVVAIGTTSPIVVPGLRNNIAYTFSVSAVSAAGTSTLAYSTLAVTPQSSQDILTWTDQTTAGSQYWQSITSSSDGTKLAATVSGGDIYTSADSGTTWTDQTAAGSRLWTSITSSSDGTKLAATVSRGDIYTSADSGVTWATSTASGLRIWTSITSSSDGTKLAATVSGGDIYTSADSGTTWTDQTAAGSQHWYSITSSSDGTKLAAVVAGNLISGTVGDIYTSADSGTTWTDQTAAGSRDWQSITSSSDGTKLAATVSGGDIYTSADSGTTWTDQTAAGSQHWQSITSSSDGTKLAAVVAGNLISGTVGGGGIYTSADSGTTWTDQTTAGSRGWQSITSSSDGTKLAATVSGGDIYTAVYPAPIITSIAFSTTQTTATVTWVTDQTASSTVNYGLTISYSTASTSPALTTTHSVTLMGLSPSTTYHFQVAGANSLGIISTSTDQTFTTSAASDTTSPTPGSITFSNITNSSITASSTGASDNVALASEPYQYHNVTSNTYSGATSTPWIVTGLTSNTNYTFEIGVEDSSDNWATTTQSSTTTLATITAPIVTTSAASAVTQTSASLNGSITATGGANTTQSGFAYGTSTNLSTVIATTTLGMQTGTTALLSAISSLIANTTYYVRAYAANSAGTGYGAIVSFTTSAASDTTPPGVTLTAPINGSDGVWYSSYAYCNIN